MASRITLVLTAIGVVLTAVSVVFGPSLLDRFSQKYVTWSLIQNKWECPTALNCQVTKQDLPLPNYQVNFSVSNETDVNCDHPLFRVTVPGTITEAGITDTKEKKEAIEKSEVFEQKNINDGKDTVRFESERLGSGSFITGIIFYKGSTPSVSADPTLSLSSASPFKLRRLGEQSGVQRERTLALFTGLFAALTALALAATVVLRRPGPH